ncbi:Fic family protein [Bifidobacterium sp. MA2]|uniref:Fic family protein n=1 Tax=Bifidobacterium santillanense TaxID=2809028 RepID=A0ABS5UND1_9BIFI|nr:Fic family protein [Bifidobacterium santillanense]MBT1172416.1 Fic family protein [Bifidobacterium santillanense]
MSVTDVPRSFPSPLPVPPIGHEPHVWHPDFDAYMSRSERRRETGDYYSAVPAVIAQYGFSLPEGISADLEEAAYELSRFDAYAAAKLGMDDHELSPMASILLRTESTSSSQIENLTVGARKLALQELGEGHGGNAQIVVGNVHAMRAALDFARNLDEPHLLAMHRALLSAQPGFAQYAGRYRDQLVWVGGGRGPRHATHVAPQPELVAGCMDDLLAFLQRDDLPVILQCAVVHAQFETIHPFVDGNGRVGRALVHAVLRNKGLIRSTTPPVSAGLLTDTQRYFAALGAYREGDAEPIVACFADACRYSASTGVKLIDALEEQLAESRERLHGIRRDSAVWRVLPRLIEQPIINRDYLSKTLGLSPMTASRAIRVLTERGVLDEITGGRRNTVWEHRGILSVLDDYAARLRRD